MLSKSSIGLLDCIDQPILLVDETGNIVYANNSAHGVADCFKKLLRLDSGAPADWLSKFQASTAPIPHKIDIPGRGPVAITGHRLKLPEFDRPTVLFKLDMDQKEKVLFRAVKKRIDNLTIALHAERRKSRLLRDAAQVLDRKANTDTLTHLMTRDAFEAALEQALSRGTSEGSLLIALDLNEFKAINDTYGHQAGDHVLSACGERLCMLIRDRDFAARFGGDEFCIFLPGRLTQKSARGILARLYDGLAKPIPHHFPGVGGPVLLQATASIGAVLIGPADSDKQALLFAADQAMYESKKSATQRPILHTSCSKVLSPVRRAG